MQYVSAQPIDLDSGIAPSRALAIAEALARRVLPLVRLIAGRAEPLASGALYYAHGRLLIVTCKHLFDGNVAIGDVGVPLAASGRWLWLRDARARAIEDPIRDLVFIAIEEPHAARLLARHWLAVPLDADRAAGDRPTGAWVVAGYPYAQMRRVDETLHAKPVFVFTRVLAWPADETGSLRATYARTARRADGLRIHAPALDGVSGATCWSIHADDRDEIACVLQPAAVQVAFKHDAYLRAEPLTAVGISLVAARARAVP